MIEGLNPLDKELQPFVCLVSEVEKSQGVLLNGVDNFKICILGLENYRLNFFPAESTNNVKYE